MALVARPVLACGVRREHFVLRPGRPGRALCVRGGRSAPSVAAVAVERQPVRALGPWIARGTPSLHAGLYSQRRPAPAGRRCACGSHMRRAVVDFGRPARLESGGFLRVPQQRERRKQVSVDASRSVLNPWEILRPHVPWAPSTPWASVSAMGFGDSMDCRQAGDQRHRRTTEVSPCAM